MAMNKSHGYSNASVPSTASPKKLPRPADPIPSSVRPSTTIGHNSLERFGDSLFIPVIRIASPEMPLSFRPENRPNTSALHL